MMTGLLKHLEKNREKNMHSDDILVSIIISLSSIQVLAPIPHKT